MASEERLQQIAEAIFEEVESDLNDRRGLHFSDIDPEVYEHELKPELTLKIKRTFGSSASRSARLEQIAEAVYASIQADFNRFEGGVIVERIKRVLEGWQVL